MKLLMLSGDRDVAIGRKGPFHATLQGLAAEFERIDVLTPRTTDPSKATPHPGVFVESSPVSRIRQSAWLRRRGGELINSQSHDLIVSHDYGIFSNGRAASHLSQTFDVPYVSEIHHVPGHPQRAQWWEPLAQLLCRIYVARVARHAVAIRVVNQHEMPLLLSRWGVVTERILVLPSVYIDRSIFQPATAVRKFSLGFVGRLVANKNLPYVADVFASVATHSPTAQFVVVGHGPERGAFRRRLLRLGILDRITFVDWLDNTHEMATLYRSMDALLTPSLSEGGPRVCLEAMACGTPVFATRVGIMPDTIDHGTNGWLLPWSAAAGSSVVTDILKTPERLKSAGQAASISTVPFEKSNVLKTYATTYRQMAMASSL